MVEEFTTGEPSRPEGPVEDDLQRLADVLRALIEHSATLGAPPDELHLDVAALERLAERLAPLADATPTRLRRGQDLRRHWDRNPIVGRLNPVAPPIRMEIEGAVVHGYARLGMAYQGPPGHVHGGVVASCFDQLLGIANVAAGNPGMTGSLTIRYRRPTPLHTDLHFECVTPRVEGRKAFAQGTLHADGELTAEAEGVFISITESRAAELFRDAR